MQGHLARYYGAGVNCTKKIWGIEAKAFYDMFDEMLKQPKINAQTAAK
jgi:hypothetical protein